MIRIYGESLNLWCYCGHMLWKVINLCLAYKDWCVRINPSLAFAADNLHFIFMRHILTNELVHLLFYWLVKVEFERLAWETNFLKYIIDGYLASYPSGKGGEEGRLPFFLPKSLPQDSLLRRLHPYKTRKFLNKIFRRLWTIIIDLFITDAHFFMKN